MANLSDAFGRLTERPVRAGGIDVDSSGPGHRVLRWVESGDGAPIVLVGGAGEVSLTWGHVFEPAWRVVEGLRGVDDRPLHRQLQQFPLGPIRRLAPVTDRGQHPTRIIRQPGRPGDRAVRDLRGGRDVHEPDSPSHH